MPATFTPIRYPGGKTKLYPVVKQIISLNGFSEYTYAEAFAGGAGLAIKLLLKNDVPSIIINDLDRAVYCMWDAIIYNSHELCKFIEKIDVSIDNWLQCRAIYQNQNDYDDFKLGCAAFFLNRTNVSGILDGGVIGGIEQHGKYKINARFSKKGLIAKIENIAQRQNDITLCMLDAEDFIRQILAERETDVFAYFDPPYIQKGPGLYRSSFDELKHRSLAKAIQKCACPWIATYDDDSLVEEIYGDSVQGTFNIRYSAYRASTGKEKFIVSPSIKLPDSLQAEQIGSFCC